MKTISLFVLVLSTVNVYSANVLKEFKCYDKVVQQGTEDLLFPKEAESLCGASNVDHFISNFDSKTHAPIWNSVGYFYGRYVLSLQIPISVDYTNCTLIGAKGTAFIQVNEVTKVEFSKSGIAEATMREQWRLNANQWKRLVKSKGDWSVVKLPILTNAPVPGFNEYVRQGREPIRNRKEGFDKPIKQTLNDLHRSPSSTSSKKDK